MENKVLSVLKVFVIILFTISGVSLGYIFSDYYKLPYNNNIIAILGGFAGILVGALIAIYLAKFLRWFLPTIDQLFSNFSIPDLLIFFFGVFVGASISLLFFPFLQLIPVVGEYLKALLIIVFSLLGAYISGKKRDEIKKILTPIKSDKKSVYKHYIIDTSAIIDGRINEFLQTGILEGIIVIPGVVLSELQKIADSTDYLKRARGRRGLDTLDTVKESKIIPIEVVETKKALLSVDEVLVEIARQFKGILITNDYNLTRIGRLKGIKVLNLSELSYALRLQVLPGEDLNVAIIREGKEQAQGIGYLDDGTMIVVEDGKKYLGRSIEVTVSSILQTSSGKMIFAKPK
ncbi:MAG: putative PIN and TRAM-domain containing protein YacL [candidate division WS2 bacterium]|uniref:PIN and TRAM-domain containing protein YacL n=1 Tax=Psychracetigena formicireducens TaxID=2986056 RepID=A0A9E2F609_PSYF1|nr:putative PIN and TRAM-domain containing protein YacL [Candidatus Psychracetigena formicireducens]